MGQASTGSAGRNGRIWIALALLAWLGFGAVLLAMGRAPICECGTVKLWHGVVNSAENSQHISDWYSFSHVIHGFLFYGLAWLVTQRLGVRWRDRRLWLFGALLIEGGWELLENSPVIIDRYRAATISYGYEGDSVLNSLSDMAFMALGFLAAARMPVLLTVVLGVTFELFTAWMIRDNLTLNVLMLVAPVEAVRDWQAGA